ncbi:MAG: GvpL/GvpF family gas vesicle protein [Bacteroidota bacterium]
MPQPNLPAAVADHPLVAELSKQLNPLLTAMLVERALAHVGSPEAIAAAVLDETPEQELAVAQAAEQHLAATVVSDMQADPTAWAEAVVARLEFTAPALAQVYEQVKARVLQQMVEQALRDLSTALTDGEGPAVPQVEAVDATRPANPDGEEAEEQADAGSEATDAAVNDAQAAHEAAEPEGVEETPPGEDDPSEALPAPLAAVAPEEESPEEEAPKEAAVQTAYLGPEQPAAEASTDDFFSLEDLEEFVGGELASSAADTPSAPEAEAVEETPAVAPDATAFSEEDVAEAVHEAIAAEAEDEAATAAIDEHASGEPLAAPQADEQPQDDPSLAPEDSADTHDETEAVASDEAEAPSATPLTKVDVPADQPVYPERYVYAISIDEQDLLSLIELPNPVIEDGQYEIVRQGDLSAIVSTVPADVFSPDVLRAKFSDVDWMTHYVGRHEAVVAAVADKMPTMPLRFATVLPDRAAVQDVLREHEAEWKARVRSLHQTATFQVRLVPDDEQVRALVVDQSERVLFFATELEGATSEGAADLRQRMLASIDEEIAQRTQATAQRLAEVLEQHAVVSRGLPTGEGVAWHQAYLVGQTDLSLFTDEVDALQREYDGTGFSIVAQGPQWPYAFVPSVARPAVVSQAA